MVSPPKFKLFSFCDVHHWLAQHKKNNQGSGYWEHIGKHIENLWNNMGNTLGTNKSNNPLTLPKRKNWAPWVEVHSPHWLPRIFMPTFLCFFIILGLWTQLVGHSQVTLLGYLTQINYGLLWEEGLFLRPNRFWFVVRKSFWGQIGFGLLWEAFFLGLEMNG